MNEQKVERGERLGSMFIDHLAMSAIAIVFFIPGVVTSFNSTPNESEISLDFGILYYLSLIGFAIYFCKDSIHGRSIGKRLMKLQVVEKATGQTATPLRCMVRNIFVVIWPVEVIVTLISPARRIGDFVAGTEVVPFNPELPKEKPKYLNMVIAFLIAYVAVFGMMWPLKVMQSKTMKNYQVAPPETSEYVDSLNNPK